MSATAVPPQGAKQQTRKSPQPRSHCQKTRQCTITLRATGGAGLVLLRNLTESPRVVLLLLAVLVHRRGPRAPRRSSSSSRIGALERRLFSSRRRDEGAVFRRVRQTLSYAQVTGKRRSSVTKTHNRTSNDARSYVSLPPSQGRRHEHTTAVYQRQESICFADVHELSKPPPLEQRPKSRVHRTGNTRLGQHTARPPSGRKRPVAPTNFG